MIKLINFPFCNFHSLVRYFKVRNHSFEIYENPIPLKSNDILFIPGVGTFGLGMEYIESRKLRDPIIEHALKGGKIIGICLGMQLLLNSSEESLDITGLGIIKGKCKKLNANKYFSVPHIGWNTLKVNNNRSNTLLNLSNNFKGNLPDFYFVHSYHCVPKDISLTSSFIQNSQISFSASIEKNNIQGYQFHPEKSGKIGYILLDQAIKQKQ
tara:strand:+ start:2643 stop:3275 length:633 start_codon:yes stop_codon:yes gene_type:complete